MFCSHAHGDFVNGYWLCGQCYAKLAERPARYVPADPVSGGDFYGRQTVVHAEVRRAEGGLTLAEFVAAVARRVAALTKGGVSGAAGVDYEIDLLRAQGAEFGDPGYAWDTGGAHELVDEDAEHWDVGTADGSNGGEA